ncbi:MAG: hypothetical protein JG773_186 [Spirochaeta sp.]|jgi:hypothetical protein|nr:hypothetical protein [Spirochaeta sp.]
MEKRILGADWPPNMFSRGEEHEHAYPENSNQ